MPGMLKISLAEPIASVKILDNYRGSLPDGTLGSGAANADGESSGLNGTFPAENAATKDLEARQAELSHTNAMLRNVIAKLSDLCDKTLANHEEEVAGLAVEIARKILVQKVETGDYEIEAIVKEALKNAPPRQELVVHLNPQDLVHLQKAQEDGSVETFGGIKFVPDQSIGRAECRIESPKGIIESFIDEHLERIRKALEQAK
jgi:flagellar biosynthesis/type III secretory pathway protein FliH